MTNISIIVPILNEAEQLPDLLQHLQHWQNRGSEIILVDGASSDHSLSLMEKSAFTVLHSQRGRARQMNAGAEFSKGSILLFLHADTRLPINADERVLHALSKAKQQEPATGKNVWGRFNVCIRADEASTIEKMMFKVISWFINKRSRLSGIATGDQAIFVTRITFQMIGGFVEQPLMEDIELSRMLKKIALPICLTEKVTTSARRWQNKGLWRTIWLMWCLRFAYWRGVSAEELAQRYR